jgi:hypothetical protein
VTHAARYDAERDFVPLVRTYALQSMEYGLGGNEPAWDLQQMESEVFKIKYNKYKKTNKQYCCLNFSPLLLLLLFVLLLLLQVQLRLLAGKTPITIQICQFQYAGEVRQRGRLATLQARVPQQPLSASAMAALWREIDTQHHVESLFRQLEDCIHFIVSVGGGGSRSIDGAQLLHDYALTVLLLNPGAWDQCSSPTVRQHVQLRHLQSLYMALEERMHGSPLDNVLLRFRQPLPAEVGSLSFLFSFFFFLEGEEEGGGGGVVSG